MSINTLKDTSLLLSEFNFSNNTKPNCEFQVRGRLLTVHGKFIKVLKLCFIIGSIFLVYLWYSRLLVGTRQSEILGMDQTTRSTIFNKNENSWKMSNGTDVFEIRFKNVNNGEPLVYEMSKPVQQCPPEISLLVLVPIPPQLFEIRDFIRNTWLSKNETWPEMRFYFLVGAPAENKTIVQAKLEEEKKIYGDIIQAEIPGYLDNYRNIYLKTYSCFQWYRTYCPEAKFLLKNDADTPVDLSRLRFWIEHKFDAELKKSPNGLEIGRWVGPMWPYRDPTSKWFVSKDDYPDDNYPEFLSGPAYLLSAAAVDGILAHTFEIKAINVEDVLFTGILAKMANVSMMKANEYFRTDGPIHSSEPCEKINIGKNQSISVPQLTAYHATSGASIKNLMNKYKTLKSIKCA